MGILFIIALLLAWPTFGLSIVAWVAILFINAKGHANKVERREKVKEAVEPLFEGRFAEFFLALDMPIYEWEELSEAEAHQCGRHIMNYIAHNPTETSEFIRGLQKWKTKGAPNLCDPITAAQDENRYNAKGEIHAVSYRAVEALMTNNSIPCFKKVDFDGIAAKKAMMGRFNENRESEENKNINSFLKTMRDLDRDKYPELELEEIDVERIEMSILNIVRTGGGFGGIGNSNYEKAKAYAFSKGGVANPFVSSVKLIVLGKKCRIRFTKMNDGDVEVYAAISKDEIGPTGKYHVIPYGESYERDRDVLKRLESPKVFSANSQLRLDRRLNPSEFVKVNYSRAAFFITDTLRHRSAGPDWTDYEKELNCFLNKVKLKASSADVDLSFAIRFLADEVGINYLRWYMHIAERDNYDIKFMEDVCVVAIESIWRDLDARHVFIDKWNLQEEGDLQL